MLILVSPKEGYTWYAVYPASANDKDSLSLESMQISHWVTATLKNITTSSDSWTQFAGNYQTK